MSAFEPCPHHTPNAGGSRDSELHGVCIFCWRDWWGAAVRERDDAGLRVAELERENTEFAGSTVLAIEREAVLRAALERAETALADVVDGGWEEDWPEQAVALADVRAVLKARRDLPYPPDTGRTHWDGCWRERGHHNCAVARIAELESERDRLARENKMHGDKHVALYDRIAALESANRELRAALEKSRKALIAWEDYYYAGAPAHEALLLGADDALRQEGK